MTELATTMSLTAAVVAGLAGSGHCFAMCGGLAGALGMRARATTSPGHSAVLATLLPQLGRLAGYALAGALCGGFGAALRATLDVRHLAVGLRVASGVLIVLVALRVLLGWNTLRPVERLGARFWRLLQPLVRRAPRPGSVGGALLLGFLWGWLPCGLVYSMLLFATLSGSAAAGAAIMLAFGIGTLPALLMQGLFAARLTEGLRLQRWPRALTGGLLLVFGVWLALAAVGNNHGAHVHGAPSATSDPHAGHVHVHPAASVFPDA